MSIDNASFKGMTQALQLRGFLLVSDVQWIRQPSRVNGRWSCEVAP